MCAEERAMSGMWVSLNGVAMQDSVDHRISEGGEGVGVLRAMQYVTISIFLCNRVNLIIVAQQQ